MHGRGDTAGGDGEEGGMKMVSGYETEEELIQNLVDAGCGKDTVDGFLSGLKRGQKKKGLLFLQEQREALLDGIHKDQSCIEYLDEVLGGMRGSPKAGL